MVNQEQVEIPAFNLREFMMNTDTFFGVDVYNWITYLLIVVSLAYIYHRVFQTKKLPVLKLAIVYVLLAIGAFVLLIFQWDAGLPILYSLLIAVSLILIVRIRYWLQGGNKQ